MDNIAKSLDKYLRFEESELALKIFQYMKIVETANSRDIQEAIGEIGAEGKQRTERAIAYLVKEGYLLKNSRKYILIRKAEWKDTFMEEGKIIDFKMPYFYDSAIFRDSDMIVIGAKSKIGKSHVALNIIKELVEQGKKPNYVSLESGNRFVTIAKQLCLSEGDFRWCVHFNPQHIELEDNAITILDWLLPTDYAETDKLFKYFAEQLVKHKGILIIFVQLKRDGTFFAENMLPFFPSFVCKYDYDKEDDGTYGHFSVEFIREPLSKKKKLRIPCKFDFDTKRLVMMDTNLVEKSISFEGGKV